MSLFDLRNQILAKYAKVSGFTSLEAKLNYLVSPVFAPWCLFARSID